MSDPRLPPQGHRGRFPQLRVGRDLRHHHARRDERRRADARRAASLQGGGALRTLPRRNLAPAAFTRYAEEGGTLFVSEDCVRDGIVDAAAAGVAFGTDVAMAGRELVDDRGVRSPLKAAYVLRKGAPTTAEVFWHAADQLNGMTELCDVVHWIRLNRELLLVTGEAKYADRIDEAFHNAFLAGANRAST